jgi:tetratricopeptide (TPR) repeat protein
VDGQAEGALAALETAPASRERDLNRAVVHLYAGEVGRAEAELVELRRREPRWTPALRWLARAQTQLGQPEALDSASALLGMPGADARDQLWAGRLFLEKGELERARASFLRAVREEDSLALGWLGLAGAEARLGHAEAAHEAGRRAIALRGREPVPGTTVGAAAAAAAHVTLTPAGLHPGERLRYRVKYLFFTLALLTLETESDVWHGGRLAQRVVFTARSNPRIPFFHIDSRFESVVGENGAVLAHRHVASDSDAGDDAARYDMDPDAARCTVRTVRDGLLGYDVLPLPPNAQDGISVLLVARALARARGSAEVPTAVGCTWKATQLRTMGPERIRWCGHEVQTVRMQSIARYRGPAGLSGIVDIWVSDDERAVPYKVKMKIAVGSVVLELLPDEGTVRSADRASYAGPTREVIEPRHD